MPGPEGDDELGSGAATRLRIPNEGWCRRDWVYAGWMFGAPAIVLGLAALIGYPLITSDDLIQNFPLEELAGQIVAHGHAPLYNPYLWSGTPLLAGANAHALLPITLLFTVLPPLAAWVAGEVIVLAAAAVGCQLFLRRTGCNSAAAALGGASFGLGGFLSSQIVHIDFAAAAAAIPWALVALHGLACRSGRGRFRHCLLLCVATAWVALTGSPDIVIDAVVVCAAYAIHVLLLPGVHPPRTGRRQAGPPPRSRRREDSPELQLRTSSRRGFVAWSALGAGAGLAIGALQWWPAALFFDASQRTEPSFNFIAGGSLSIGNLLELLVPHVMGGGLIGPRSYAGTYPLVEVDGYPGMLALIAVAVLITRILRPESRRWRVWLVVAATGIALAMGSHTPLEHVVAYLPVAGDQRLPSRALITFALAASLLLGYFLDEWPGSPAAARATRARRTEILAAAVPVAGVLAVVIATVVTTKPAGGYLTARPGAGWSVAALAPALALSGVLAVAAFLIFVFHPSPRSHASRSRPRLPVAVAVFVVADLGLFAVNQSALAPAPASELSAHRPLETRVATLARGGRVLVLDPELVDGASLDEVGGPDLGVLSGLREAGGYSSIVWGRYSARTGTHTQDAASLRALADGTFARLGVRVVLVLRSLTTLSTRGRTTSGEPDQPPAALLSALNGWADAGPVGPFLAFVDPHPAPLYEVVRSTDSGSLTSAAVHVLSSSPWTGATRLEVVSPSPADLVRDVADVPGWHATVTHAGRLTSATVQLDGLVQSVQVPAGRSVVSFSYVPPGWNAALGAAVAGALVAAGLVLADIGTRRRRNKPRGRKRRPGAA